MKRAQVSPLTAKVFQAGNSKALRLPRELKIKARAYELTPTATGFIATDLSFVATNPATEAKRLKALQALHGSAPGFPGHTR